MSKHAGNRSGRAAKKRRARHERRSSEADFLKRWLLAFQPTALRYARPQVGLRQLARICLSSRVWERAMIERLPLRVPPIDLAPYRYGGFGIVTARPLGRVLYMDGI